ncbi:1-phosphofructokinase family hexose kinase [Prosthecomicrobium sp. N25]|uniref:1-phosphofructokinase family hexose kinase n=1 Tax=Prosthecomicrobium sp. N25 TaxID=3129254 RepID=UPI003077827B
MPDIVTLTINPAIDLWSEAEVIRPTHKIRTWNDLYDPGGGGINVARVLTNLGADVEAIAIAGGVTGALLGELIEEARVRYRLVHTDGRTRINHVVFERRSGAEYRFVLDGPRVSPAEIEACLRAVAEVPCRYLVASGSLPPGVPATVMAEIGRIAAASGARYVVDTSGEALRAALAGGGVHLVKPSLGELQELVGEDVSDPAAQDAAAMQLVETGRADMVAVTLGPDGALLASRDGVLRKAALPVEVRSTVGAGDSFLGAVIWSLARGESPAEALAWGVAAGAAAISQPGTKLCTRENVERLHAPVRPATPS